MRRRFSKAYGLHTVGLGAFCLLGLLLSSCKSPEYASIQPLPEEGPPLSFKDLSLRVKDQVFAAQEFFFSDRWEEVQKAARALQDSAGRLKNMKPDDTPDKLRNDLTKRADGLNKAADDLHAASGAKDVHRTNDVFQRLNLIVRDLRVE